MRIAVERVGEGYRCNVCGTEVAVTKTGGTLVCRGQNMEFSGLVRLQKEQVDGE